MRVSNVTPTAQIRRGGALKELVGSGDRIALFALPFTILGSAIQVADPDRLAFDGSSQPSRAIAIVASTVGGLIWAWSVGLILAKVPKGDLITTGPFAVVKHPVYTSVGLLVLPSLGILMGTWLGAIVGVAVYAGSRLFAPAEEAELRDRFGASWDAYARSVKLPWL
ncbi:MAG TPA: isoprenylcysteine carboxylmethyltransferase family protein [Candidatus Limnocylindrales bacterium]|nr:isoprenylcysteine carboxylmethyltransferase family protein [Candidatus Limnocylindrales bacterium]